MLSPQQRQAMLDQTRRRMAAVAETLRWMNDQRWRGVCPVYRAADDVYRALRRLESELQISGEPPDHAFPRYWRPR